MATIIVIKLPKPLPAKTNINKPRVTGSNESRNLFQFFIKRSYRQMTFFLIMLNPLNLLFRSDPGNIIGATSIFQLLVARLIHQPLTFERRLRSSKQTLSCGNHHLCDVLHFDPRPGLIAANPYTGGLSTIPVTDDLQNLHKLHN